MQHMQHTSRTLVVAVVLLVSACGDADPSAFDYADPYEATETGTLEPLDSAWADVEPDDDDGGIPPLKFDTCVHDVWVPETCEPGQESSPELPCNPPPSG